MILLALLIIVGYASSKTTITPLYRSLEVGQTGQFECTTDLTGATLTWKLLDSESLPEGNSSADGRFLNKGGILVMERLLLNDSGPYQCLDDVNISTEDLEDVTSATLKVFVMPSYMVEGIVALVVNLILIILFIGCIVHNNRQQRLRDKFPSLY
ncbi:hypothetical protein CLF_101241 [Clonorchis sinensis]|uniref:Ig-like domain-containing protein n=1 Tax=Clonorchis sinensis TaxID=79923 RepID=H2KP25_CLOSI|nr:hypothetical protein CLF_101241 [Clonorchis sinensis]